MDKNISKSMLNFHKTVWYNLTAENVSFQTVMTQGKHPINCEIKTAEALSQIIIFK